MSLPHDPDPVLLIVAAFSRHEAALDWARARLVDEFGPLARTSTPFDFIQTKYYEATMGTGLRKLFFVFDRLVAPEALADIKRHTNDLEAEQAQGGAYPEVRPLNLDPGILSLGKFMLATTKDQAHRLYLRDGIYAESTLFFRGESFEIWPWTYADYRQPQVITFLNECRALYRAKLSEHKRSQLERGAR
jgi:hypothetical protein